MMYNLYPKYPESNEAWGLLNYLLLKIRLFELK
jgi:hypothetical protein